MFIFKKKYGYVYRLQGKHKTWHMFTAGTVNICYVLKCGYVYRLQGKHNNTNMPYVYRWDGKHIRSLVKTKSMDMFTVPAVNICYLFMFTNGC